MIGLGKPHRLAATRAIWSDCSIRFTSSPRVVLRPENVSQKEQHHGAEYAQDSAPCCLHELAEGVGFEPTSDVSRCRFSRPVPSTARPPLQPLFFKHLHDFGSRRDRSSAHLLPTFSRFPAQCPHCPG